MESKISESRKLENVVSNSSFVLSRPITLPCGMRLENRFAKAATSEQLADYKSGDPTEDLAVLYERWARGGPGLIITGNVMVTKSGIGEAGNVYNRDKAPIALYNRWAEAAQSYGAACFMQLNHAGRQVIRILNPDPVAPSEIPLRIGGMFAKPRALFQEEIRDIVRAFATTASLARESGFSGVQLHGAHGYLISQFLSPLSNQRTDSYGGSLDNRMRFLIECYRAVRSACGKQFPVSLKLNSADFLRGGFASHEAAIVARILAEEGIDLLEISGGTYEKPEMLLEGAGRIKRSTIVREAHFVDFARLIRNTVTCPLMLTGGLRTPSKIEELIKEGSIDIAGMARPLIMEPDLPREFIQGRIKPALTPFTVSWPISRLPSLAAGLDMYYYTQQMKRMSAGLEPAKPNSSVLRLVQLLFSAFKKSTFLRSTRNNGETK
ncbi:NADH:flavin oxidoreductase/NADH oxidase family protein [Leptospira stimsonii]|uniref:NADH:flavin oxidoreductase/NADH oxidase family protein n=1 Tax=Leptospira stimsonii TaxID=2202203 RepID=A0ABY2N4X2_9LEPT|nr:NADH:flavin oxidoreductase/NADH oxidase family protein [Leptospira stimsonii]TGK19634.1 NADH:flavin oxidoreductase/NADH oxidase family protein [Leptospira stimsonii]TGM17146.1 NADH:flavin oxidoreductase/NADH oxidase family protein [Leptospira stimsonii]